MKISHGEGFEDEQELAIFDILTRPDMKLKKNEIADVKKVARELLSTLKKEKFMLDWKKKQMTRAAVRLAIEDTLDELPEAYVGEILERKANSVYQYVYGL